jgi:hypothetical protein
MTQREGFGGETGGDMEERERSRSLTPSSRRRMTSHPAEACPMPHSLAQ